MILLTISFSMTVRATKKTLRQLKLYRRPQFRQHIPGLEIGTVRYWWIADNLEMQ
ncbi:MAG: hypothetical protein KC708_16110 [Anaerolineae bacterium]|nr:hypothetical protein [Anaerolineae bacterium]